MYINIQFELPCFIVLLSYSSEVIFHENVAKSGIGFDVYGASVRSSACSAYSKQIKTIPYCGNKANISFLPSNLNSSLSLVSLGPKRVCLCDSNGYPNVLICQRFL